MKIFTYKDYITSIHNYRIERRRQGVAEDNEIYQTGEINKKHDKLLKKILTDKKEMALFINQFLLPKKKIEETDLTNCKNSYINPKYQNKEADLVYHNKDKTIYFLVEHQSTVDTNMPYRILNYCIDIIQDWVREKRLKNITTYPIVVPVVIYTGERRWTVSTNFADKQVKETTYGNNHISLAYNVIDINRYSKSSFLEKNSIFGYSMLIEKAKDTKEIVQAIESILDNVTEEDKLLQMADIIHNLFLSQIDIEMQKHIIQKIDEKVGENDMDEIIARIRAGDEKRLKQKEKEVKKQTALKMLQKGLNVELIQDILGIKGEEIKKLKAKI